MSDAAPHPVRSRQLRDFARAVCKTAPTTGGARRGGYRGAARGFKIVAIPELEEFLLDWFSPDRAARRALLSCDGCDNVLRSDPPHICPTSLLSSKFLLKAYKNK
jgi:hypothetical protein